MLITIEDRYNYLNKLVSNKPKEVLISTFNMYAGIMHDGEDAHSWGGKYENEVHKFLDSLINIESVKIIVGIPPLILCKEKCEDCIAKQYKWLLRLIEHKKKWNKFEWKYIENSHLKCIIFDGKTGVSGGRNLSGSNWTDIDFELTQKQAKEITSIFHQTWIQSKEITMDNLEEVINNQIR